MGSAFPPWQLRHAPSLLHLGSVTFLLSGTVSALLPPKPKYWSNGADTAVTFVVQGHDTLLKGRLHSSTGEGDKVPNFFPLASRIGFVKLTQAQTHLYSQHSRGLNRQISMSSRPALPIYQVPGQPTLHTYQDSDIIIIIITTTTTQLQLMLQAQ